MFDRLYFEAAKANGFEAIYGDRALLTPAGLSDAARKQWASDFEVLVAYAREQERTLSSLKKCKPKKKVHRGNAFVDKAPSPPRVMSTLAAFAQNAENGTLLPLKKGEAYEYMQRGAGFDASPSSPQEVSTAADEPPKPLKPLHPLRQANQELYAANKKLANEKPSAEAKLQRMKATLSALTSKVETKLETSQCQGVLMQHFPTAVTALLQHSAKEDMREDDAIQPEVVMLTKQLTKLGLANERFQDELADLRKQQLAARQKKKAA